MTKMTSNAICACCGADITAPQFYKGKAYGYTCITKVSPQKRVKDPGLWIKPDSVTITMEEGKATGKAVCIFRGIKFVTSIYQSNEGEHWGPCFKGGLLLLAKYKNGTKPAWRGISKEKEGLVHWKTKTLLVEC